MNSNFDTVRGEMNSTEANNCREVASILSKDVTNDVRAVPHMLTYLQFKVNNFCILNAILFKLWQLICEMYM